MNKLIDDKEYVVRYCWTPLGPLILTGKELRKRPDLKGYCVFRNDFQPINKLILLTKKHFD